MVNKLLVAFFFVTLVAKSFALNVVSAIRAVANDNDGISANVIEGIVIGIVVLITIPLSLYVYKMYHRTRQNSKPLFVLPHPGIHITSATPDHNRDSEIPSASRHITLTRPHKVYSKVNAPTYRD